MKTKILLGFILFGLLLGVGGSFVISADADSLSLSSELLGDTDPFNGDTDGDGLLDGQELNNYNTDPTKADTDGDGLNDGEEINNYNTNPEQADTDNDGLPDEREVMDLETSPTQSDTDGDGLMDKREVEALPSDPTKADTDNDGLNDGKELEYNTDSTAPDTDSDGLNDGEEVNAYNTDPTKADTDNDRLTDLEEIEDYNTEPTQADTDGDGLNDYEEVNGPTNPTESDTDSDGLNDGEEEQYNTEPTQADTDGDGLSDGLEVNPPTHLEGADPLKKDVFLKVDYSSGVQVPVQELQKIKRSFSDAPVSNPDGSSGIQLHFRVSGSELDTSSSHDLQSYHSDVYSQDFEEGKGMYHLLIVEDLTTSNTIGVTSRNIDGLLVEDRTDSDFEEATGNTVMHELGHQLGLMPRIYSGIDSDHVEYDRYTSVMNYNLPTKCETDGNVRTCKSDYSNYTYSSGQPFDDWNYIEDNLPANSPSTSSIED